MYHRYFQYRLLKETKNYVRLELLYIATKLCFTELNESIVTINIYKHGDKNTHEEVQLL